MGRGGSAKRCLTTVQTSLGLVMFPALVAGHSGRLFCPERLGGL